MNYFYLDASAWVKRYHTELGSDLINVLFQKTIKHQRIITSLWSFGETFAVLNRNKNRFNIPERDFNKISSAFLTECENIHLLPLNDDQLFKAVVYISKYNLNSADAYHLSAILQLKETLASLNHTVILISADERLLKATKGEGIPIFDPEHDTFSKLKNVL